jgi:hypothetical protein
MQTSGSKILNEIIKHEKVNANQFAESIGLKRTQPIYDILNGKVKKISTNYVNKILSVYPHYNYDQLLTGEGEILKTNNSYSVIGDGIKYVELPNGIFRILVPFVSTDIYEEYINRHTDPDFINSLNDKEFTMKELKSGSFVDPSNLKNEFKLKQPAWIIVLKNAIVCKQITEPDEENGTITCHSYNPFSKYSDFKVKLNEIQQLFRIIKRESNY